METIQEKLRHCDREAVIGLFIHKYVLSSPLCLLEMRDMTIDEITEYYHFEINGLIDRIINADIKPNGDFVFIVIHCCELDGEDIWVQLIKTSDLDRDGFKVSYGYSLESYEVTAGYPVADTCLTDFYIDDLLAEYLHEVSLTGFQQERLQKVIDRIDKAINEPGKTYTHEEVIEKLKGFGYETEEPDPEQQKAYRKLMAEIGEYNERCQEIELEKLRR